MDIMKKQPKHADVSGPQSVTEFIKLKTGSEAMQIGFTNQKISPHGGLITFAGFLQIYAASGGGCRESDEDRAFGLFRVKRHECRAPAICFRNQGVVVAFVLSIPIFFRNGSSERGRPRNFSIEMFTSRESPTS